MTGLLFTVLAFVVAISVLVVVHEFGHYWVARRLGVKVLRFSVGFGRPLWTRRFGRDRTELTVAAIPLGGYVKMLDEHEGEVDAADLPRAFNRQALWRRTLIVLAGPMFNFLFAIGAYAALYQAGIDGIQPVIGRVAAQSPAEQAGFRVGETLLTIDGRQVQTWDERRLYLYEMALDRATVRFEVRDRDGIVHERLLDLSGLKPSDVGAGLVERQIGLSPQLPELLPVIGSLDERGPAATAGLQTGDRVLAVDGRAIKRWPELVEMVSARPAEPLRFSIERDGVHRELIITPQAVESDGRRFGRIGVGVRAPELPDELRATARYSAFAALGEGAETTWRMSILTLKMLGKMLTLQVSTETISGPLTIAQYAGASARVGLDSFVMFLAVVSVSLGVLNLLPIPILDGGHLLFYAFEAVTRRPLSEQALYWAQQTGILLLAALMALAFYNDLTRIFR